MAEVLLKTIPHLSSTELATIIIVKRWPFYDDPEGLDDTVNLWHSIDSAIAGPMFAGLRALTIDAGLTPWFSQNLPKHMPLTVARGALRIK